jgi:hypothetical protein
VNRSPSRSLRPLLAAAVVTVALVGTGRPPGAGASVPAGSYQFDCSQATQPFDDSPSPKAQELHLTLGEAGDGYATLRLAAPTLVAGPIVVVAGAEPGLSASGDVSVTHNGSPVLEITGIPAGTVCRFQLPSLPGYYVATSPAGGASVDWWVSSDLSAIEGANGHVALAANLLGGAVDMTDACDILSAIAVGAAVPSGSLGALGPVTVESAPPDADAWQSECLWSVALGDGTTEPMAIGVALVVLPPGDQAVADFTSAAGDASELPGFLEVNRRCYLVDHTVSCLVDDVSFAVAVAANVAEGSPQAFDLDTLAVTLAVNVADRLA